MKSILIFFVSSIISIFFISCKNDTVNLKLNNDNFIKNLVFSGDRKRITFYKVKTKKEVVNNITTYVYFEKHESQNYDSLVFKNNEVFLRSKKLLKIDSMSINFKNKKTIIYKLLYPDVYTSHYLIYYISKDIGIISQKSNYYNVHVYYDIENNYDLNNEIQQNSFLRHELEN